MDSLVVELNREGPHSINVASNAFHPTGPFEIVLDNHGAALHVYLQLDDDLAGAVRLSAGNHFVQQERIRRVQVDVDESQAPVRGRLKIVTGYGSETAFVTITVEEVDETADRVAVDESLGQPRPRPEPESGGGLLDRTGTPVVALGVLAVVVALLAALALGGGMTLVAALVVLVGAGVGVALLRQ